MSSPRALNAPNEPVVIVSEAHVAAALAASRQSDRRRTILPFHKEDGDLLHRMLNAMQPGTYVRPHRHLAVPKPEVFLVLAGAIDFAVFDDAGELTHTGRLAAGSSAFGVDLAPGLFHTLIVRAPDTVLYEVKLGPYDPATDKEFAPWAPAEDADEVPGYQAALDLRIEAFHARTAQCAGPMA